jgi:hypothetical protein
VSGWLCLGGASTQWRKRSGEPKNGCGSRSERSIRTTGASSSTTIWYGAGGSLRVTGLELAQSRPCQKNDIRFVEQKNSALVWAYIGNYRIGTAGLVRRMKQLYDKMWLYYNFLQPVFRMVGKEVGEGRVRRRWDTAMTPHERLLATGALQTDTREKLGTIAHETNPRALRRQACKVTEGLWDEPDETKDVRPRQQRPCQRDAHLNQACGRCGQSRVARASTAPTGRLQLIQPLRTPMVAVANRVSTRRHMPTQERRRLLAPVRFPFGRPFAQDRVSVRFSSDLTWGPWAVTR